ncbi:hypothetical protein PVT68_04660 [Microbulbifer bruguierae]|uniref:Uncharacterized protein n=1 Tax=Microbulbifer bruguierae TaxID=3029061 RepID=A0ABY8NF86_9GAMM|nr:hypothetical protein [Microbulbifer bruguierae]WGL17586.1 hypothetical protein PVT68_04660 [Microbulbifer bruguierae]
MGLRNSVIRRPRRLNKHNATLARRRKKVRWLLAQRSRVRSYRRFFRIQCELGDKAREEQRKAAGNPK